MDELTFRMYELTIWGSLTHGPEFLTLKLPIDSSANARSVQAPTAKLQAAADVQAPQGN